MRKNSIIVRTPLVKLSINPSLTLARGFKPNVDFHSSADINKGRAAKPITYPMLHLYLAPSQLKHVDDSTHHIVRDRFHHRACTKRPVGRFTSRKTKLAASTTVTSDRKSMWASGSAENQRSRGSKSHRISTPVQAPCSSF